MVQRLLLGVCSSPAVLSPPPCKDAAGETLGWEQAASLSWRA